MANKTGANMVDFGEEFGRFDGKKAMDGLGADNSEISRQLNGSGWAGSGSLGESAAKVAPSESNIEEINEGSIAEPGGAKYTNGRKSEAEEKSEGEE